MLTRERLDTLLKHALQNRFGLTVFFFNEDLTVKDRLSSLLCYGSVSGHISVLNNPAYVVLPIKYDGPRTKEFLFLHDSPLLKLFTYIYENSYKDFYSFDEFKQMIFNKGIVLEKAVYEKFCPASFMALAMSIRDWYDHYFRSSKLPENWNDNLSGFGGILQSLDAFPELKGRLQSPPQIELSYTKSPFPKSIHKDFHKSFFMTTFKNFKDGYWTSGTDSVFSLMRGFSTTSLTEYNKVFNWVNLEANKLYAEDLRKKVHIPFGKNYSSIVMESDEYKQRMLKVYDSFPLKEKVAA